MKKKLGNSKRKIAALKIKVAEEKHKNKEMDFGNVTMDEEGEADAGDNFGGKRQKKSKK